MSRDYLQNFNLVIDVFLIPDTEKESCARVVLTERVKMHTGIGLCCGVG